MCRLLRALLGRRRPPAVVPEARHRPRNQADGYYQSASYPLLTTGQIRDRRFPSRLRGLDPDAVRDFLHRLANELAAVRSEARRLSDENARIRRQLHEWQSRFGSEVRV